MPSELMLMLAQRAFGVSVAMRTELMLKLARVGSERSSVAMRTVFVLVAKPRKLVRQLCSVPRKLASRQGLWLAGGRWQLER